MIKKITLKYGVDLQVFLAAPKLKVLYFRLSSEMINLFLYLFFEIRYLPLGTQKIVACITTYRLCSFKVQNSIKFIRLLLY